MSMWSLLHFSRLSNDLPVTTKGVLGDEEGMKSQSAHARSKDCQSQVTRLKGFLEAT